MITLGKILQVLSPSEEIKLNLLLDYDIQQDLGEIEFKQIETLLQILYTFPKSYFLQIRLQKQKITKLEENNSNEQEK